MSELYAILVLRLHYPPEYVLDKMEMYEVRTALKYDYYASKDLWESARLIAYLIALVNSKRSLKMEDIIQFPWEVEENGDTSITAEQIELLRNQANKYITKYNGK